MQTLSVPAATQTTATKSSSVLSFAIPEIKIAETQFPIEEGSNSKQLPSLLTGFTNSSNPTGPTPNLPLTPSERAEKFYIKSRNMSDQQSLCKSNQLFQKKNIISIALP